MKKISTLCIALVTCFMTFSQNNVDFKKSNFSSDKEGFDKAITNLQKADNYYFQGPHRYERALKFYLLANNFNPNNSGLNQIIGKIYTTLNLPGEALPYIQKAVDLDPSFRQESSRVLAETFHLDMQWDKAIDEYTQYIKFLESKKAKAKSPIEVEPITAEIKKMQLAIAQCNNGKVVTKDSVRIIISNLGSSINTKYPEYSAIASSDDQTIYFTTRRSTVTGGVIPEGEPYYYEDVFFSTRVEGGQWDGAKALPGSINTKEHEGLVALSPDGKKMIIYRYKNGGDLFESTYDGANWSAAKPISEINTPYRESHAAYSPDGNTLYYVSENVTLGAQNRDIFFVTKQADGKWGNPTRLDDNINTPYNEDAVFVDSEGNMYFASQGHNSIGGYDIFKASGSGADWTKAENMGYPVNTPADDLFFTVLNGGKKAYFNSNRRGGSGEKDIYQMLFVEFLNLTLKGKFLDINTGELIENAEMTLQVLPDTAKVDVNLPKDGKYSAPITTEYSYRARINALGYENVELEFKPEKINIDSLTATKDFYLTPGGDIVWKGNIINAETGEKIVGKVTLVEIMTNQERTFEATSDKKFEILLERGRAYSVKGESKGFISHDEMLSTNETGHKNGILEKDIPLMQNAMTGQFTIIGTVFDAVTKKEVPAKITVYKENKDELLSVNSVPTTGYTTKLNNNTVYFVKVDAENYNILEERLKVNIPKSQSEFKKDFYVSSSVGQLMSIKNIYFDFDSYALKSESVKELEALKKLLLQLPDAHVELSGHTDIKGTYEYNKVLSLNRARAAYDWLIENGIKANRIKYTYYSFSKPAHANTNADGTDSESGRALNRRVEFKVFDPSNKEVLLEGEEE